MHIQAQDLALCKALRDQPRKFGNRYSPEARNALQHLLFRSLAHHNEEYLTLLFPQGLDNGRNDTTQGDESSILPIRLSDAQGATDGAEYSAAARGKRCGHAFRSSETTYSCRTCASDDTVVLCAKCFEASDHDGHQVIISMSPGTTGCCDCGDSEAWDIPINCSIHTSPKGTMEEPMVLDSMLPLALQDSIAMTVGRVFDYICDVFSCSPEQMKLPKKDLRRGNEEAMKAILKDEENSRLNGLWYQGTDHTEEDEEYALILWNDEKHTVDEVSDQVSRACRMKKQHAERKAHEIDEIGRSVVERSKDLESLLEKARIIEQIKVTVTIRSTRDTFREDMCATMIEWLVDIAGCSVGNDNHILKNTLCAELLKPWRKGSKASNFRIAKHGLIDNSKSDGRLEQMRAQNLQARLRGAQQAARMTRVRAQMAATETPITIIANQQAGVIRTIEVIEDNGNLEEESGGEEDEDENEENADWTEAITEAAGQEIRFFVNEAVEQDMLMEEAAQETRDESQERNDEEQEEAYDDSTTGDSHNRTPAELEEDIGASISQPYSVDLISGIPKTPSAKVTRRALAPGYWFDFTNPHKGKNQQDQPTIVEKKERAPRLDCLILYDLRMWKLVRNSLRHLYITTVVTVPEFKRILGLRFAELYTFLAQLYLISDREPELSIINLSLQMLTTPSITAEIVEKGRFFTRLLAILYTFLTTRQVGLPQDVDPAATMVSEPGGVTNRRIGHFLSDMKFLLESKFVQQKICLEDEYLLQYIDFVKLYQGICPSVRAVGEHIEYESDAWFNASQILKEVTWMSRQFCESFKWTRGEKPESICRAIRQTARATIVNSLGSERNRFVQSDMQNDTKFQICQLFEYELEHNTATSNDRSIVDFVVERESMSFHHALHYTLSWLVDAGKSMSREQIQSLLNFSQRKLHLHDPRSSIEYDIPAYSSNQYLLALFDVPLRVCAWLAQIKAGIWVRNGASLRHQMSTYRSTDQREASHHRDIFLLQVALVVCTQSDFLASAIDRFGLTSWVHGNFQVREGFEETQMVDIAEDFLHLLIVLASDRTLLQALEDQPATNDMVAKRDIAHVLCFKPLTHSSLLSRLPKEVTDTAKFSSILLEIALYRPPEGLADSGTFELKEQYYDDINPYQIYYSKNQREEAENAYRSRVAKLKNTPIAQTFYEPRLLPIRSGIFVNVAAFTQTPLFSQIIACFLGYIVKSSRAASANVQPSRLESFLQIILHSILIAILEDKLPEPPAPGNLRESFLDFAFTSSQSIGELENSNILYSLLLLLQQDQFQTSHPKIRFILTRMQQVRPAAFIESMKVNGIYFNLDELLKGVSSETKSSEDASFKKKQALERQAKVLASFKKQQNEFLEQQAVDWGLDDSSDGDDDVVMSENQPTTRTWSFPSGNCIFCQEETNNQQLYGTLAYIKESRILRQTDLDDEDYVNEIVSVPPSLDKFTEHVRPFGVASQNIQYVSKTGSDGTRSAHERRVLGKGFPSSQYRSGPVTTGCGHILHYSCFETYLEATQRRQSYQVARNHPERLNLKEFVCPLCKALGNAFLPIIWTPKEVTSHIQGEHFEEWISTQALNLSAHSKESLPSNEVQLKYITNFLITPLALNLSNLAHSNQVPSSSHFGAILQLPFYQSPPQSEQRTYQDVNRGSPDSADRQSGQIDTDLINAYLRLEETATANQLYMSTSQTSSTELNSRSKLCLAASLAFSVAAAEIAHRGVDRRDNIEAATGTILDTIPEHNMTHLRILSETVSTYVAIGALHGTRVSKTAAEIQDLSANQLNTLFGPHSVNSLPLFDHEIFTFFTECSIYAVPYMHLDVHHILRVCYIAEMVKVVVAFLLKYNVVKSSVQRDQGATDLSAASQSKEIDHQRGDQFAAFVQFVIAQTKESHKGLFESVDSNPNTRFVFDRFLYDVLRTYALVFLRKCLLLLNIRFGIDFQTQNAEFGFSIPELERLSSVMRIPAFDSVVAMFVENDACGAAFRRLSAEWIGSWVGRAGSVSKIISGKPKELRLSHPGIFELVALPYTHDTLNTEAMGKICPTTGRELVSPALCLFCGAIFCGQASCCTDERNFGGCMQHQENCGGKIGMFLDIKRCCILFKDGMNGTWLTAPYLDRFGETDMGLRKRRQLYLNQRRYDKLIREVWLNHGISSVISRKLEADINTGGWETL